MLVVIEAGAGAEAGAEAEAIVAVVGGVGVSSGISRRGLLSLVDLVL